MSDERVWFWFDVTGAAAGDRARDEWYDPDGNLYRSANWAPLPSGGYRCFWDSIFLANAPAAAKPGRWTIRVYYNDTFFFSLSFALNVANLQEQIVSRALDESIQCKAPTPVSVFLTTDQRVWVWFFVNSALPGDTARIEWYEPNGGLYTTQDWAAITHTNEVCFWTWLGIANQPLAAKPGAWRVRVFYNNAPFFTASFTITEPSYGGAVVIDGTDANEHGHASGGKNQEGWLYMQRVLESLAAHVPISAAKVVVDVGTDEGTGAREAIDSAFNLSSLPSEGWRLVHVNGSDNITLWLTNLSLANTGILYVPTYNNLVGDLSTGEMSAVNARATNIARFFTGNGNAAQGGAVFAMSESNTVTGQGAWQWLQGLFPGIGVTDFGTTGVATDIKLTLDGANTLAGVTNDDLVGVHPWHNSFFQLQGRLKVLGVAPDPDGVSRQVVLGGEARDLIVQPCILNCFAQAPAESVTGAAEIFVATHTLSDCTGAPSVEWDFGDGQRSSEAAARHAYGAPGTYTWTATINAGNASTCVRAGQIVVRDSCTPPSIITQPSSKFIARNEQATLTVMAVGQAPLQYQWYEGTPGDISRPVAGATAANFRTPPLIVNTRYWARVGNNCDYADSKPAIVIIAGSEQLEVEAVDPACREQSDCRGTYLTVVNGAVVPDTDVNRLAEVSVHRSEIVTDGVTLLLLRVRSSTHVTFSIPFSQGRGSLMTRQGTFRGRDITVGPENTSKGTFAFALYQAPLDYADTEVTITATSARGKGNFILKFRRPPVVLVHGVWSNGNAWEGLAKRLRKQGFDVCDQCLVDYKEDNVESFDPLANNAQDQAIVNKLHEATQQALYSMRKDENVAVTQVDVIGHSMGGLVARSRVASSFNPYRRLENCLQGDFHKIITVGTPHFGSNLADWLVEHRNDRIFFVATIQSTLSKLGFPIGPAICEFRRSSRAIKNIRETPVPSHAIIGISSDDSNTEKNLNLIPLHSFNLGDDIDRLLGGGGNHDTIVPINSQQGSLTMDASTTIKNVVHADIEVEAALKLSALAEDTNETKSEEIWNRIAQLLTEPILRGTGRSPVFDFFQELTPPGALQGNEECRAQMTSISNLYEPDSAQALLTPVPGTVVRPGEVINVSLNLTGGNLVDGALFSVDRRLLRIDGGGPFSFSYSVPDRRAGRLEIASFTFGPGPQNYLAETYLIVRPGSILTSLSASPQTIALTRIGTRYQLRVTGQFSDGTQIDVTSNTAGTSYSLQSGNNAVISVSPEGEIEARGIGQETILITNAGKSTRVSVYVSPTGGIPGANVSNVSAASYDGSALAPESIVAGFGVNLANSIVTASSTPLPTSLSGAAVIIRDSARAERLAPLFFVSPNQINYQIPPGTAPGPASVTVMKADGLSASGTMFISPAAPALFSANASGQGVAAAVALRVKADGTQIYEPIAQYDSARQQFIPIQLDLGPPTDQFFLILFGTGLRFYSDLSALAASLGNIPAELLYAGPQGGFVGLDQVNLRVPRSLAGRGEVEIQMTADGKTANPVRVSFR
jgi:uncharacterized protein (TIGR03437 family)